MKFIEALNNLNVFEGGYSYNTDDKGGETYKGISRVYHPLWSGWRIIDDYKKITNKWEPLLEGNVELKELVEDFYKKEYWNKFKGNDLPYLISEELLEQSVNIGTWKTAGKQLQRALNLLSRNGKLFTNLKVDGIVGSKTLEAVKKVNQRRLLKVLNGLQFMHYFNLMNKEPKMRKFIGWFDRT